MPIATASTRLLRLAGRHGSVSRREVAEAKIHTQTLSRLVRAGTLERVARGRYRLPNAPVTEHHGLAVAAAAAPKAVICLLSKNWEASKECYVEYRTAENLNKRIFAVRIDPYTGSDPTREWQQIDLVGDGPSTTNIVSTPDLRIPRRASRPRTIWASRPKKTAASTSSSGSQPR